MAKNDRLERRISSVTRLSKLASSPHIAMQASRSFGIRGPWYHFTLASKAINGIRRGGDALFYGVFTHIHDNIYLVFQAVKSSDRTS